MFIEFGKKERNLRRAHKLIYKIKEPDLIVLPELFNTGYSFLSRSEVEKLSEDIYGPTIKSLTKLSGELSTCIVAGFAERSRDKIYNSAIVVYNGDLLGVYRKSHLFFLEKKYFDPGDTGFKVFRTRKFNLGTMICFDWIFPEAARTLALKRADIIAHPANLVLPYAQTAMLARSIENRVYTVTANRIGIEVRGALKFKFTGQSQITTPDMKLVYRASEDKEEVFYTDVDISKARNKRITDYNDIFEDRRTDLYFI